MRKKLESIPNISEKKPKLLIHYHYPNINQYIKGNILLQAVTTTIIFIIEFLLVHAKITTVLNIILTILIAILIIFYTLAIYFTHTVYVENVPNKKWNLKQTNYKNIDIVHELLSNYKLLNKSDFLNYIKGNRDKEYNFNLISITMLSELINLKKDDNQLNKIIQIQEEFFEKIKQMGYIYPKSHLLYNKINATEFIKQNNYFYDMLSNLWIISDKIMKKNPEPIQHEINSIYELMNQIIK